MQRLESDFALQKKFLAFLSDPAPEVTCVQTILLYSSMGSEIDTRLVLDALYKAGKRVLLPRCLTDGAMEARVYHPEELVRHPYGMWEPGPDCPIVEADHIDLILVPALCYDRGCRRMGRGGGYYDRYLAKTNAFTVGLCRDALLCDAVPVDTWDVTVHMVLTETAAFRKKE